MGMSLTPTNFWSLLGIYVFSFGTFAFLLLFLPAVGLIARQAPRVQQTGTAGPGSRRMWVVLASLAGVGGLALLMLAFIPYAGLKAALDGLSRDHNFASLPPQLAAHLRLPLGIGGIILGIAGTFALVFRKKGAALLAQGWAGLVRWAVAFWADFKLLLIELSPEKWSGWERWSLLGMMLVGLGWRAAAVSRPMSHDEAYTIVAFAVRPWAAVVGDYSLPNNHVFHTILVHLSLRVFGLQPWAVRLPVLLAGVLMLPVAYGLARRLFGRPAAWMSTAVLAVLPRLVLLSTNARGYALVALFTLVMLDLALLLNQRSNRAGWFLLAVSAALGFYATPIMLYPFGMVFVFLLLSRLFRSPRLAARGWKEFLPGWLAAGLGSVLLTVALYIPLLLGSGTELVLHNRYITPLPLNQFLELLPMRLVETWWEWWMALPNGLGWLAALGFALTLVVSVCLVDERRIQRLLLPIAGVGWIFPVMLLQHTYPWPKIWSFLLAIFIIYSLGGAGLLLERLAHRLNWQVDWLVGGLVLGVLLAGSISQGRQAQELNQPGPAEEIALQLQQRMGSRDAVVISAVDAPPLWYYFLLHGMPLSAVTRIEKLNPAQVWIVVDEKEKQTLQSVMVESAPSGWKIVDQAVQKVARSGDLQLYFAPLQASP